MVPRAEATGILQVKDALMPVYNVAARLTANETTNLCECYMSKVSKFTGGKRVDFSTGPSYSMRCRPLI